MNTTTTERVVTKKKRNILNFEPPTHVSQMISSEIKRGVRPGTKPPKGALKKILVDAVLAHLGPKYPELLAKFKTA